MAMLLFPETPAKKIEVAGRDASLAVGRIFCVGRNYADHAKEMGAEIILDKPFFFLNRLLKKSGWKDVFPSSVV